MVKLRAPDGWPETVYWEGVIYPAERGVFTVPDESAHLLGKLGFVRVAEPKGGKRP